MAQTSLFYYQDQYLAAMPRLDSVVWQITGAKASSLVLPNSAILGLYDTITQGVIDAFYGSVNEVLAAKYDSTAMGTDAFGVLLNYNGQVQKLVSAELRSSTGTGGATIVDRIVLDTGLTDSSLSTQATKTSLGNLALRFVVTGLDALTSGQLILDLKWVSK